jgi:hypothetical protein
LLVQLYLEISKLNASEYKIVAVGSVDLWVCTGYNPHSPVSKIIITGIYILHQNSEDNKERQGLGSIIDAKKSTKNEVRANERKCRPTDLLSQNGGLPNNEARRVSDWGTPARNLVSAKAS